MKFSKILLAFCMGFLAMVIISSCGKDDLTSHSNSSEQYLTLPSTPSNHCDQPTNEIDDYEADADLVEALLYVNKDYDRINELTTKEKLFDHYNSFDAANIPATQAFDLHGRKYQELGHDGYIDFATSEGHISQELNDYFKSFRASFVNFIMSEQPSFDDYKRYVEDQGVALESNNILCAYDKYMAEAYHVTLLGVGKYLYGTSDTSNYKNSSLGSRDDCDGWWENLVCGTGGVIVAVTVGVVVGLWSAVKSIFKKDQKTSKLAAALLSLYKIAVQMWKVGVSFFEWCCETLYGNEIVECGAPVACYNTPSECGLYTLRVVGPGFYSSTNWINTNTSPAVAVTPAPRLDVTIPDPSSLTAITGTVTCTDEDGNEDFNFSFIQQFDPEDYTFETPAWGNAPSSGVLNQKYEISVTNPPSDASLYTMSWSSATGYGISPVDGDLNSGRANLTAYIAGTYTIEVTYTHICSGQKHKKSKTVSFN